MSLQELKTMDDSITACTSGGENQESSTSLPFPTLKSLEEPQRRIERADGAILVWWDIETCPIPPAPPSSNGVASLLHELHRHGITCDGSAVTLNVYGNGGPGSKVSLDSLIMSGVALRHRILPCKQPGSESAALKAMIVDIALWALTTPAPADVFLISATRDTSFRDFVSGLHLRGYDIHLATRFNFGYEVLQKDADSSQIRHLFKPMPRHWSASKQLFVARTAPSARLHIEPLEDANPSPNVQLQEKLQQFDL